MLFTLYVNSYTWLGWSNQSGQVRVYGHPLELVARVNRAATMGLRLGGVAADLSTPWAAHRTLTGALRERAGFHGPITFAGLDDDGLEMTFIPEPDAEGVHGTIPQDGGGR